MTMRPTVHVDLLAATPELKERLATLYAEPWASSPQAFGAFLNSEIDALGKIIRAAGIKAE